MPHIDAKLSYVITLTDREFRLVTLALADMIKDEEDIQEALKLNTQLCRQRAMNVNQAREQAERALENASRIENPNIPPYGAGKEKG